MCGRKAELDKLKRGQKKFIVEQEKMFDTRKSVCDGLVSIRRKTVRYPQPPTKPVNNNRVVFGAGFFTGLIIGIWVSMFLCNFIPLVLS